MARPRSARALRVALFLGPVLTSFVASWLVTGVLPRSHGRVDQAAHLGVLLIVSTVVLVLLDRAARRMLPLAMLLDLSLLFPDAAPSRLAVARDAIRRRPIEMQLARVREAGVDPGTAAVAILTLVAAMSRHDRPTRGHAERVRMFTDLIAIQMRVPERDRDLLRWAAILHDIGKLRVSAALLNKPGKPDAAEWAALRAHPAHGAEIAGALLPWLGEWGQVIVQHHERWDGTGYPRGLAAQQIHLGARIVSVADAYDVMTSARAYRRVVSRAEAYEELIRFSGSQFDPAAVRAMVSVSAPRLRRAQRVLAWFANVPLVASHVVPATTLVRVFSAGVIASGAATGVGVAPLPPPPDETRVIAPQVERQPKPDGRSRATKPPPVAKTKTNTKAKAKAKAPVEKRRPTTSVRPKPDRSTTPVPSAKPKPQAPVGKKPKTTATASTAELGTP